MLIFTDLVMIVTEVSERGSIFMGKRKTDKSMRLAHEIEGGIGKVAEVKDWSGWQGEWEVSGQVAKADYRPFVLVHSDHVADWS